jgi:hypothetical protein
VSPSGVTAVSTSDAPFVFGISDPEVETWLLAAPVEHGAAMRWTIWNANEEPIVSGGQGLTPDEP